jgi:hypothetical protein
MDFITVNCTLTPSLIGPGQFVIKFTFEDIPFVIYPRQLDEHGINDEDLKKLNFHANDHHTICSVYDLRHYHHVRRFPYFNTYTEPSEDRTERIKLELLDPNLKLTAPRSIFMNFIRDTDASINNQELQGLYPDEFANGDSSADNPVSIIYAKKDMMFPRRSGGRRKNGRHCRRTRQKTKRVKCAKLMKRSRKANHIKNVNH